ncbi:WXG100 family type VII secretion target [Nocardia fusca]|uniref:WXG100 family type VII secretion target n=1 Tax=Nocardia fusca TaxID=941183 RepID=UPI003799526B
MPAGDTVLDAGAVLAAVNSLNGIHQSLESGLGSVVTDAEALISGGWAGLAADGIRDHFQQVRNQFEQLLTDAREIVGHIPECGG